MSQIRHSWPDRPAVPRARPLCGAILLGALVALTGCESSGTVPEGATVRIEGTVTGLYSEDAVSGAEVQLDVLGADGARAWAVDTTDLDGSYRLEAVAPGGCTPDRADAVVVVRAQDHREEVMGGPGERSRLSCSETTPLDVELYRTVFRDPQTVAGGLTATQLSVGRTHACVIAGSGTWCWGSSLPGRLGNAAVTGDHAGSPVTVTGGEAFVQVAAGNDHTCALDDTGAAWCWGDNSYGQVGADTSTWQVDEPYRVNTDLRFVEIQAGRWHSCGLTAGGAVYCWGDDRGVGAGGDPGDDIYGTPQQVLLEGSYVAISSQFSSSCALRDMGALYCWGFSYDGELGGGESSGHYLTPIPVVGGHEWGEVAAGVVYGCGLTTAGAAYCWGQGHSGKLGTGDLEASSTPVPVSGGGSYVGISAGGSHTCAITATGSPWCWGGNASGELGTAPSGDQDCSFSIPCVPDPVEVPTDLTFTDLQAGDGFTCGVTTGQGLVCWGARELLGAGRPLVDADAATFDGEVAR